jgi:hypothetical protein
MGTRKKAARVTETTTAKAWALTKGGNVKRMVTLRPQHVRELDAEAEARARAAGTARPDAGAVLREILDAWVAKRK